MNLYLSYHTQIPDGKVVGWNMFKQVYWGTDAVWSEGYFVSTVGIDEAMIHAYIEEQGKKDAGQTKFEIS